MRDEAEFLSIALPTVQDFNEVARKKRHKKIIDMFQNGLLAANDFGLLVTCMFLKFNNCICF